MDKYKRRCYFETLRKNILPVKNVKYHEKDKIYLSLGSLVFFKDPFQLKERKGYIKDNEGAKDDEITLHCAIYKNDRKITNVIEIKIRNNKLMEVCYGKYKPSTPTYRNYKNINSSFVSSRRGVKFKVVRSRLLATKKRKIALKTNEESQQSDKEYVRDKRSKLRVPIIVRINNVLVFKIRRLRSGLRSRLDNSTISLSVDLYVNNYCISTTKKQILVPSNQYNTPRKSSRGIGYNTGCVLLYSKGISSVSNKDKSWNCYDSSGECCCDVKGRKVCHKHIGDITDLITGLIGSMSTSTTATGELSGSKTRSIGTTGINSSGYRRYILYRYLQVLYYLLSSEVEICKDVGIPVSMVTFRTVESSNLRASESHQYDILCGRVNEILFRYSGLLSVDSRDLLYIEIPTEFKVLQLLYRSSLLGINRNYTGEVEEHKIKIYERWYSYKEINSIVYKYYNQLAKSPNSICLLLRFTDYSDRKQYELLQLYLEKLDNTIGTTTSNGTNNFGINVATSGTTTIGGTNASITSSNVILELVSRDFVSLDTTTRRKIISILIKNVHKDLLKRYFRQFLYFLKYDIDDTFFNHILKVIENDVELSLKTYFFLLSFSNTTTATNTTPDIADTTSATTATNSEPSSTRSSENVVYLECLSKYVKHLMKVDSKVLNVIKLEQSFLNIFIRIINSINETRKKYALRNHYLHVLFNELKPSELNRGKIELSIDRERKLIKLSPHVPLITDVDSLIKAIDYQRSYIYKSSNYPLILQLKIRKGDCGNKTSDKDFSGGTGKDMDQRIMLKMNYVRNDELCLEVLSLFKHILMKHQIPVLTYKMISVYKNLGYIQLLPNLNGNITGNADNLESGKYGKSSIDSSNGSTTDDSNYCNNGSSGVIVSYNTDDDDGNGSSDDGDVDGNRDDASSSDGDDGNGGTNSQSDARISAGSNGESNSDDAGANSSFKENFINSFSVISILNYLLEVGDRHYENVMLQRNGVITNFDFNFIFGSDPNILKKPPFRFSNEDLGILEKLGVYDEFVERFTLIFGLIRRRYKSVLNLLYTSGVDIVDVNRVERRFLLDLNDTELSEKLCGLIRESHHSYYPQFIDNKSYRQLATHMNGLYSQVVLKTIVFKGFFLFFVFSLRESLGFYSSRWPAPANKVPTELDLASNQSTSDYVYTEADHSSIYIARDGIVFRSLLYKGNLLWTAADHTEYAAQVIFSPDYMVTLLLLDSNLKHFKIYGTSLVEVGLNELPTSLNIDFKYSTYDCEYAPINHGHVFHAKSYYRFATVKAGDKVIYSTQNPEECVYLVSINDKSMTMLQLNGELRMYKLMNQGWVIHKTNVELPELSAPLESKDVTHDNRESFLEGFNKYFSKTMRDCPNLAIENIKLRNELDKLDDELRVLKQDYDEFKNRVASLDNSIERAVESVFLY
ncbi:phosphatidylinositol 3-kinase [Theileria orientalis]|uniref:Phosphatidylinositol 3-kinase n=1 Tax=Theileria orientalis TaxID=68886 RepID=A0A976M9X4_THEOR|nr:phosphatidylinositol 3-kinase [Theileria orientalis]